MKRFFRDHAISLTLLLILAVMLLIFCFSAQNAEESNEASESVVRCLLGIFYRVFDRLDPRKQLEIQKTVSHYVRKAAHFTEFALLGFSLFLHFRALSSRFQIPFPAPFSQLIGSAYAISDELHQKAVSGRSGQFSDVLLDSFGVLFGILILWLLFRFHEWLKKKDCKCAVERREARQ